MSTNEDLALHNMGRYHRPGVEQEKSVHTQEVLTVGFYSHKTYRNKQK